MSLYRSTRFSIKMVLKNKQRTLTMALGIMIAISLVIGVLGYIDYSQNEVISRAVQDVPIDMTIFQNSPDTSVAPQFTAYLNHYQVPSFITNSEFIQATLPLSRQPGIIISTNTSTITTGKVLNLNINGLPATVFGINMSYLSSFPEVFRVLNGSATSLSNSTVFISQSLSDQTGISQNDNINVTIQKLSVNLPTRTASVSLITQKLFNVSGIVYINSQVFQQVSDSFTPLLHHLQII